MIPPRVQKWKETQFKFFLYIWFKERIDCHFRQEKKQSRLIQRTPPPSKLESTCRRYKSIVTGCIKLDNPPHHQCSISAVSYRQVLNSGETDFEHLVGGSSADLVALLLQNIVSYRVLISARTYPLTITWQVSCLEQSSSVWHWSLPFKISQYLQDILMRKRVEHTSERFLLGATQIFLSSSQT